VAIPAKRKSDNIVLSVNKHIEDNFSTPQSVTTVFQDDNYDVSDLNRWLDVVFLSHGAGRLGETLVQLDLYSRILGDVPGGDKYSAELGALADALHEAMNTGRIQLYDFSVDPSSPTAISKAVLMVQNSAGKEGQPESDQVLGIEDGVVRRSMTYRLRAPEDATRAPSYYD
jgi:hypothetical protein